MIAIGPHIKGSTRPEDRRGKAPENALELLAWYPQSERQLRTRSATATFVSAALSVAVLAGCGGQSGESPAPGTQAIKTGCGLEMVAIPAGQFLMGVNEGPIDTKPAHQVKVDAFLMDQCEVTQEAYEKVIGKNPSRRKNPQGPGAGHLVSRSQVLQCSLDSRGTGALLRYEYLGMQFLR